MSAPSCPQPPSQVLMGLCPHVWGSVAVQSQHSSLGSLLGVGSSLCLHNQSAQANSSEVKGKE